MKLSILSLNRPGITDFAKERNDLLKKAKSDWVFFVDTDEVVTPELKKEVDEAIQSSSVDGYFVYRVNYFLEKYVGTDKILRIGRRDSGKWVRRVHEVWKINGKLGNLENPLIHNTSKNLHDFIDKINYYSTLHAAANLENGKRSNLLIIVIYPVAKFFHSLLIGRGFVFSMLQSLHSFLSWSKQWQLQKG